MNFVTIDVAYTLV